MLRRIQTLQEEIADISVRLKAVNITSDEKSQLLSERKYLLEDLHIAKYQYRLSDQYITSPKYKKNFVIEPEALPERIVEVIKEVPVEKIVYIHTTDFLPKMIDAKNLMIMLQTLRENFINSNTDLRIEDEVSLKFKWGNEDTIEQCVILEFNIVESELLEPHKGIYAKVKKYNRQNNTISQRFLGSNPNGFKITELTKIDWSPPDVDITTEQI